MIARSAATAIAVAALGCVACTPTRSTLRPPYELNGVAHDEPRIRAIAAERCLRLRQLLPQHPFTTDGCSAWPDRQWRTCCIEHDLSYWCGGTSAQRRGADERLRACVAERSAAMNARFMFLGVRFGGHRFMPFPWRWGYGDSWPFRARGAESR